MYPLCQGLSVQCSQAYSNMMDLEMTGYDTHLPQVPEFSHCVLLRRGEGPRPVSWTSSGRHTGS